MMAATHESDLMPDEDEWDEDLEEAGPALYYVVLWYQALHPLDTTSANVPDASSGRSEPPDIFNRTKHLVWEAKSGVYGPSVMALPTGGNEVFIRFGTTEPDAASATREASKQLPETLRSLNSEAGSELWATGTLQNDPELSAFFDRYPGGAATGADSWCAVPFSDGTLLSMRRPTRDGVLLYQATNIGGPKLVPIGIPIDTKAWVQAVVDVAKAHPPVMEPVG